MSTTQGPLCTCLASRSRESPLCRPSPVECSADYAWFRKRLADPGLPDCAVGLKVDGVVLLAEPASAQDHWRERIEHLRQILTGAGLAVRSRTRPWSPPFDEYADLVAPSPSISE